MRNPARHILATILTLAISPVLAVPVFTDAEIRAGAADAALPNALQSSLLAMGGSAAASASVGSVSTGIQGTALYTGNGFNLDFTFTELLGAPHPTVVIYYDSSHVDFDYLLQDMGASSSVYGSFTLGADDIGYTYALSADFNQVGTSQMILHTYLLDMTDPQASFSWFQADTVSTNGMMGSGMGAQATNYSQFGLPTGDLIAGHSYGYYVIGSIGHMGLAEGETATEAHGAFTLAIRGPAPEAVPEPSSLALCALGLGGMLFALRKRSAARPR